MVRVRVVHSHGRTREEVPVIAPVETGKPIGHLAAGNGGECAHRLRESAGGPRHHRRIGAAGVVFVDPEVATAPIHYIERPVTPHRDAGEVGITLQRELRRPGGAAVQGAGDTGICSAPALALSKGHVDKVLAAPRGVDTVGGNVFLVDAASSATRVRTHSGVGQRAERPTVGRGRGDFRAVAVGRTDSGTTAPETAECRVIEAPTGSEGNGAITIPNGEASVERKRLPAIV